MSAPLEHICKHILTMPSQRELGEEPLYTLSDLDRRWDIPIFSDTRLGDVREMSSSSTIYAVFEGEKAGAPYTRLLSPLDSHRLMASTPGLASVRHIRSRPILPASIRAPQTECFEVRSMALGGIVRIPWLYANLPMETWILALIKGCNCLVYQGKVHFDGIPLDWGLHPGSSMPIFAIKVLAPQTQQMILESDRKEIEWIASQLGRVEYDRAQLRALVARALPLETPLLGGPDKLEVRRGEADEMFESDAHRPSLTEALETCMHSRPDLLEWAYRRETELRVSPMVQAHMRKIEDWAGGKEDWMKYVNRSLQPQVIRELFSLKEEEEKKETVDIQHLANVLPKLHAEYPHLASMSLYVKYNRARVGRWRDGDSVREILEGDENLVLAPLDADADAEVKLVPLKQLISGSRFTLIVAGSYT